MHKTELILDKKTYYSFFSISVKEKVSLKDIYNISKVVYHDFTKFTNNQHQQ